MIPYLCLWGSLVLSASGLSRHICMDAFTSGWNKNIHPWILASMGHQEAKTGRRSEQREKVVRGMEVQSKRRRVGDSVQRNSCRYVGETNPHGRICKVRCIKCRERYCIFFIGRFLQQVSGKSNSNYNTENVEGKLYLTGWSNRNTTGMDRQD